VSHFAQTWYAVLKTPIGHYSTASLVLSVVCTTDKSRENGDRTLIRMNDDQIAAIGEVLYCRAGGKG